MTALIVGRDGNVDKLGRRVGIAESEDWDVDVTGLLDSLRVGAGVRDDDKAGLLERTGNVVGEVTGSKATSNGDSTGVSGELQDSALTVGTSRDNTDVRGVIDRGNDASSKNNLLPVTSQLALYNLSADQIRRNVVLTMSCQC